MHLVIPALNPHPVLTAHVICASSNSRKPHTFKNEEYPRELFNSKSTKDQVNPRQDGRKSTARETCEGDQGPWKNWYEIALYEILVS